MVYWRNRGAEREYDRLQRRAEAEEDQGESAVLLAEPHQTTLEHFFALIFKLFKKYLDSHLL